MRNTVRASVAHPLVQRVMRGIVGDVPDVRSRAERLRGWLTAHTRFQFDPTDSDGQEIELVRTPVEQLQRIVQTGVMRGDCDDVATVGAALAAAAGLRPRFVVLGFDPLPDAPYRHVVTVVHVPGGVVDFDVTRGHAVPRATRVATMEV